MSKIQLELSNADKIYGSRGKKQVQAVRNFNLKIEEGEIVALLGSSGCGKTSTLRMIAGFEELSKGDLFLDGKRINDVKISERNVAMAFEGYSLYPPLTLYENMAFALKSAKMPADEVKRKVTEMAELLEISDVLDKYPSFVSAGQQQRVSLGRALIRKAAIYLLDEPMGQLEPLLRSFLRARIKHYIHSHGLTAVLVTHDQTEANALADRIAIMEGGELQQFDTPDKLIEDPENHFVATFFGEPPMNVFKAEIKVQENRVFFEFEEQKASLDYETSRFDSDLIEKLVSQKSFLFGIRPHQIHLGSSGFNLPIESNQWLGDRNLLSFSFGQGRLVSIVDDDEQIKLETGMDFKLEIPPDSIHFFDESNGKRINSRNNLR